MDLIQPPNRRRGALFVAIPVAVVLILLVGILSTRKSAINKVADTPLQDKPVPAVVGTTLYGQPYNIDQYRGRWVVVNFFATWCVPCRREHPELLSFARRHKQAGDAEVVTVVFQDDPAKVKQFFEEKGGEWPVITSDEGKIALDFGVTGVPESYLVDPAGIVRARLVGGVTSVGLDAKLAALTEQLFPSAAGASPSS